MDSARHVIICHITQESARHVIGCHITQETRVHNAFEDVVSTILQSLQGGVQARQGGGGGDQGGAREGAGGGVADGRHDAVAASAEGLI